MGLITIIVHGQFATSSTAPARNDSRPLCHQAMSPNKEAHDRQLCLHRETPLIGGFPFGQQCAIVLVQPRRLFREANIIRPHPRILLLLRALDFLRTDDAINRHHCRGLNRWRSVTIRMIANLQGLQTADWHRVACKQSLETASIRHRPRFTCGMLRSKLSWQTGLIKPAYVRCGSSRTIFRRQ